jgi:hypothetical protein
MGNHIHAWSFPARPTPSLEVLVGYTEPNNRKHQIDTRIFWSPADEYFLMSNICINVAQFQNLK